MLIGFAVRLHEIASGIFQDPFIRFSSLTENDKEKIYGHMALLLNEDIVRAKEHFLSKESKFNSLKSEAVKAYADTFSLEVTKKHSGESTSPDQTETKKQKIDKKK